MERPTTRTGDAPGADGAPLATLVALAAAGDRQAFGRLYDLHVDRVHRFVWFHVRDGALARDITQDVFVAALRGLPGLRHAERFEGWLLVIAHNRIANERRRASRRPVLTLLADDETGPACDLLDATGSGTCDPADGAWRSEELARAAADLTDAQRQVLALRFVAGLTLAETAAALSATEEGVKKLQQRGLAALRRRLASQRG